MSLPRFALAVIALCAGMLPAQAEPLHVAVAANFLEPCRQLAEDFTRQSGQPVSLSSGSTGAFYAQIRNGAPFHILLAADQERPLLLEAGGFAVRDSRFTYAIGVLVLWSGVAGRLDPASSETNIAALLAGGAVHHIAIANPEIAPYGSAAQQALQALGVWERVQPLLVRGQDVMQTFNFGVAGGAELAFVPLSLLTGPAGRTGGSTWQVPSRLHAPIRQDAVLLVKGAQVPGARGFLAYLRSERARRIIQSYGYQVDPAPREER